MESSTLKDLDYKTQIALLHTEVRHLQDENQSMKEEISLLSSELNNRELRLRALEDVRIKLAAAETERDIYLKYFVPAPKHQE